MATLSRESPSPAPGDGLQDITELLGDDEVHTQLQYLAVEEEPLVTNTYVATTPDCILQINYNS